MKKQIKKVSRTRRTKASSTDAPTAETVRKSGAQDVSLYSLACAKTLLRACWEEEKRLMAKCCTSETYWPHAPIYFDHMRALRECGDVLDAIAARIQGK